MLGEERRGERAVILFFGERRSGLVSDFRTLGWVWRGEQRTVSRAGFREASARAEAVVAPKAFCQTADRSPTMRSAAEAMEVAGVVVVAR